MKLLRATEQERVYAVRPSELQMLLVVLGCYPALTRSRAISKSGDSEQLGDAQKLLDEAMSERRQTMRQELDTWLKLPERFQQAGNHFEWRVENDHREWLLQIINDVRVGSWVELGSPDDFDAAEQQVDEESARHLALMELAGMFQSVLLMGDEG